MEETGVGDRAWRFLHNPDANARGEGEFINVSPRNPLKSPDGGLIPFRGRCPSHLRDAAKFEV